MKMKKWRLLPQMAAKGILSNGMVYYPYIIAGIFAVFTYFVFSSILQNDLMAILPHKAYAWVILEMGKVLLAIILFFFLIYAGSFVMKRRKKEIGLYSLLGLEKKHIGMMLFLETVILYAITQTGGIILGVVLSKLLFLILLRFSGIALDVDFVFTVQAFMETLVYFGVVFLINFANQLWEVGKSRPADLISGSRKGEKEPRLLAVWSVLGVAVLGFGYSASIRSQADSMILIRFFFAVLLVILGTYLVFTAGSVFFLKLVRRSKRVYYRPKNFITVSGMFYRMRKNAAGFANICIFSTMALITLVCTVYVYLGLDAVTEHAFPYDVEIDFAQGSVTAEQIGSKIEELEDKYGMGVQRTDLFDAIALPCSKEGNRFMQASPDGNAANDYRVIIMTLAAYNGLSGDEEELSGQDILIYTDGMDFGYETIDFMGIENPVKREVQELFPYPKAKENGFDTLYVIIARDDAARDVYVTAWAEKNGVEDMESFLRSGRWRLCVLLEGEEEEKTGFVEELSLWGEGQDGLRALKNGIEGRGDMRSMYGGLLFIGVIFGMVFFLCLIIIMYYKQIAEGYEDRISFDIMQKVGMSDEEIKGTVHRQILLVFALPLVGALSHTFVGMFMVEKFMVIIDFPDSKLLLACTLSVSAVFVLVYAVSYWKTARAYYRIVNRLLP